MPAPGLFLKIAVGPLLLVMVFFIVGQTALVLRVEGLLVDRMRSDLTRLAFAARDARERDAPGTDPAITAARLGRLLGAGVTFFPAQASASGAPAALPPEVATAATGGVGESLRLEGGRRHLHVAVPAGETGLVTRVSLPLSQVERTVSDLRRAVSLATLAGFALAAALSWASSRLVAAPLHGLRQALGDLGARRFGHIPRPVTADAVGRLTAALGSFAADLERTLAGLTHERDALGAILNGMTEGVLVVDPEGRILRTNPALDRFLASVSVTAPVATGEAAAPMVLEATRSASLDEQLRSVRASRAPASAEIEFPGPPAGVFLVNAAPLPDGGAVAVFHDVTELRRLERVRRDFVANVSHELRTPVAALQAAGETLLAGALDDPAAARQLTEIVGRNAERLANLVSDLLALARLESGELDLRLEAVDLQPVVERLLEAVAARAAEKTIELRNLVPAPARVQTDVRALEHVLTNLLDNAVKYTPAGGEVGVECVAEGPSLQVVVWDSGPGLEERHRTRVFERFYRVDAGRSRAMGGTGLGLSIVKHLVESLGGKVGVDPRPGGGSRFWFTLRAL